MTRHNTEQNREALTGQLKILDDKLEGFAKKYNTQVTSPKITYYPQVEDSLESRQIEWVDDNIGKALMIQPHQKSSGISSKTWDVYNLAWLINAPTWEKPFCRYDLLKNAELTTLERNIDQLLSQSEQKLGSIKIEDLK